MNEWELVVKIEQVFVLGAIAHNGRGKLLSPIDWVMGGKGKAALTNVPVLGHIVDVIHCNDAGKVLDQPVDQGPVPGGEKLLLAAGGQLALGNHGLKAHHLEALTLVFLGKALHKSGHFRAVVTGGTANAHAVPLFCRELARLDQAV